MKKHSKKPAAKAGKNGMPKKAGSKKQQEPLAENEVPERIVGQPMNDVMSQLEPGGTRRARQQTVDLKSDRKNAGPGKAREAKGKK